MVIIKAKKNVAHLMLAAILFFIMAGPVLSKTGQDVWQFLSATVVRRYYFAWPSMETTYFHLRYSEQDTELAAWLGGEADQAVREVGEILPHDTDEKPWLVIVPDQETFKRAFGWGEGAGALGVYLADTIKILSPRAWEWQAEEIRMVIFKEQGPLVHEYTHYVLDTRTEGNYMRWFSEGLAQLVEYRVLGYEWIESGSSLTVATYSPDQLDRSFDNLANEALAYRQSLSMVTYLETLEGADGLNRLIDLLGQGIPFYQALEQVYELDRSMLYRQWEAWYIKDARWSQSKAL